jgi:hypothetical protein
LVASPTFVWAGDGTWDNADDGFWHDSRNWAPAVPNGIGDVASFPYRWSARPLDIHLDRPTTIGQLDVDHKNSLAIAGDSPLTLDVAGADGAARIVMGENAWRLSIEPEVRLLDDDLVLDVLRSSAILTLAGTLDLGLGDLTVNGAGVTDRISTVVLEAGNTVSGLVTINNAILEVDHPQGLGQPDRIEINRGKLVLSDSTSAPITLSSGGKLEFDAPGTYSGTITVNRGEFGGRGTMSGQIVLPAEGNPDEAVLTIRGGAFKGQIVGRGGVIVAPQAPRQTNFYAANSYIGPTTLNAATLNIYHPDALGSPDFGTYVDGGVLNVHASTVEPITLRRKGRINIHAPLPRMPTIGAQSEGTIALNVPMTFTDSITTYGSTLEINQDTTIGGLVVNGAHAAIEVAPGKTLTIDAEEFEWQQGALRGTISGAGTLRKTTDANVILEGLTGFAGQIVVEQGRVEVRDASALGSSSAPTIVASPSRAALAIRSGQAVSEPIYLNNATGIDATGGLLVLPPVGGGASDPLRLLGPVDLGSVGSSIGSVGIREGRAEAHGPLTGGSLTTVGEDLRLYLFSDQNTYTGTTHIQEGRLTLRGQGRILSSSEIVIDHGAWLTIDNQTDANLPDRIGDSIPITFRGGRLAWDKPTGEAATESVGPVRLSRGHSVLRSYGYQEDESLTNVLTMESITRDPGATMSLHWADNFQFRVGDPPPLDDGIIGGWITAQGSFATYGPTGIEPLRSFRDGMTGAGPSDNVRLATPTVLAGDQSINSLTVTKGTKTIDLNGFTLNVESGGITGGGRFFNGRLTAGSESDAELLAGSGGTIEADIVDNGPNTVSLVAKDAYRLRLRGNNSYSGTTTLNDSSVYLESAGAVPNGTDLLISGGSLVLNYDADTPKRLGRVVLRDGAEIERYRSNVALDFREMQVESGTISKVQLAGSGPMHKTTDGRVVLSYDRPNYSGPIHIHAGTLHASSPGSLGTGPITIYGGRLTANGNRTTFDNDIRLEGGELRLSEELTLTGQVHVNASSRVGSGVWLGDVHLADGVSLQKVGEGVLDLRGDVYVGGESTLSIEVGGLSSRGAIVSDSSDAKLLYEKAGTDNLEYLPFSLHARVGQSLTVVNQGVTPALDIKASLTGSGTLVNELTAIAGGGVVRPGDAVGTLTFQSDIALSEGSRFEWEIHDAAGTAGDAQGWDLLRAELTLDATAARFEIMGVGTDGQLGAIEGFDPDRPYQWTIATAERIENFDPLAWEIDSSDFEQFNPISRGGHFYMDQADSELLLHYDPFGPVDPIVLLPGDANQDLTFDQLDIVQVLAAGKYLTNEPATWGEGDWNGGPGGVPGEPPVGDGRFNQLDMVAALQGGAFLTGSYGAIAEGGAKNDGQTSIVYHSETGEIAIDAPAGSELTSINIESASRIFTGSAAQNLGGSFDNDTDDNIFKATFGGSFGSLSFGNVAQAGLSEQFVLDDLTVIGSMAGGGELGAVDLVYVPEPTSAFLLAIGFGIVLVRLRRVVCQD